MANKFKGWEGSPNFRWRKMYRGQKIEATCDELQTARTAEGSFKVWKAYVAKRMLEIDGASIEPRRLHLLNDLAVRLDLAPQTERAGLVHLVNTAKTAPIDALPHPVAVMNEPLYGWDIKSRALAIDQAIQQERQRVRGKVDKDKTIGKALERFKEEVRGTIKPKTYKDIDDFLLALVRDSKLVESHDANSISESTVSDVFSWLKSQEYKTPEAHNKRLQIFRRFVRWCDEASLLDRLPKNIASKLHRMKVKHKEVKQYQNVRETITNLNCLTSCGLCYALIQA